MDKNIEVELRGLIPKNHYSKLESLLKVKGIFKEIKHRILIDYSTFLHDGGVRDRKKDIRIRVTNGKPEIIVKLGSWGGSESRKELSFQDKGSTFDSLVEIFGNLGFTKGILCERKTQTYEYKEVEFALVEVPNHSYYFEAEKMANKDEDIVKIQEYITSVCKELELNVFSDSEFFEYIETLNKEANTVFDFSQYKENFFKEKFNL